MSKHRKSGEVQCSFSPECHRWDPLSGECPSTGHPASCPLTPQTANPSAPHLSRRSPPRTRGQRSACPSSPCAHWWAWRARKWHRAQCLDSEWSCLCQSWCMFCLGMCERQSGVEMELLPCVWKPAHVQTKITSFIKPSGKGGKLTKE